MVEIKSAEKPLAGKVFLLTGASRGIGAATAIELVRRGATVIGSHRDPGKNFRAAGVVQQVEAIGGRMIAPVADVTQPDQRASVLQQIQQDFGKIDGIIFNHAGGMEKDLLEADPAYYLKVNGHSKRDLFQEAQLAGVLQDRVVVIDVPSLWSTFQHTGIKQLPEYGQIAEGKKLGERLLKEATRAHNVKFGSVCGHAIGDTTTVKLLARMNRVAMTEVEKTAEGGKLPTIADMAQAIATMAEGDFENEDIVFVGVPQIRKDEMAKALPMYSDETRYVDSLVIFDPHRAFGFYRVQDKDTLPHFPFERGGVLDVTDDHTRGHFTPDFGISILPGHKMVAASAEVVSLSRLTGISGPIIFKVPVLPGDRLSFATEGTDVSIKIGETEVASIAGLKLESRSLENPDGLNLDRLIEAAAQTLGLAFLHGRDVREVLPLFGGVRGPVEYYKNVVPGQLLEMEAVLAEGEGTKQFSGDVTFRVDDEVVAKVSGIDCRLIPSTGLERVIRMGRRRLE